MIVNNHKEKSIKREQKTMENTFSWRFTIGTNKGYKLTEQVERPISKVCEEFQNVSKSVEKETGVIITAVIHEARTVYPAKFGCPKEGEYSYTFSGTCNTSFAKKEDYLVALKKVAKLMKEYYQQSTLLLEVYPSSTEYFTEV